MNDFLKIAGILGGLYLISRPKNISGISGKFLIKITPEIRKEILKGIGEAQQVIEYEMSFSEDLRDEQRIEKYKSYIKDMIEALETGILK